MQNLFGLFILVQTICFHLANKEKISVAVYLFDQQRFEETGFDNIVTAAVEVLNREDAGLTSETLKQNTIGGHQIRIYSACYIHPPKWSGFLKPILTNKSRLASCENTTNSFVCFIGFGKHIFVITSGPITYKITRFTTHNFGLEILVRLFTRDSKVIKGIHDRGLTGSILGQAKFYRGDQKFADEDQFGKIFTEVRAELDEKKLTKTFGFPQKELRKKVSGCLAKSSFQISKSVDFETLLHLVEKFTAILKQKEKFSLNKVTQLNKRHVPNRKLIDELDEWLRDYIFNTCKKHQEPDIDFCHKNFEPYLTASGYLIVLGDKDFIKFDDPFTLTDLIRELKKKKCYEDNDVTEFKHSVLLRNVESIDEEGVSRTHGTVMEHINTEITYKDRTYFRVNCEWYLIQPSFIKELNTECEELLNDVWDDVLIKETFNVKTERKFNLKFIGKEGFLVFDTITPNNIEGCDILHYDNDNVHLIHVKQGFDNSIRDLTSQIVISAKRMREDIRTGYEFIVSMELQTKRGKTSANPDLIAMANQAFPPGGLSTIFKGKRPGQIIFCLAFVDKVESPRLLKTDLRKFQSNIAKFSLLELHRNIISMGFRFKVIQLLK